MNAWALLYDEMYGPEDELEWVRQNGGFEYTPEPPTGNVEITADGFVWPKQDSDPIKKFRGSNQKKSVFKYDEDKILEEVKDYISGTYRAHYNSNNGIQTLDLIESCGDGAAFCRGNILKYASRYNKKGSARMDIKKIIHYAVLLYHFYGLDQETIERGYETF
jgi:hypothetical protein